MKILKIPTISFFLSFSGFLYAQEPSTEQAEEEAEEENEIEEDLFYFQQRLVNLPTGIGLRPHDLEFKIIHRFAADISESEQSQVEEIFGLDRGALMSFELAYGLYYWDNPYGLLSNASVGYHRTSYLKINLIFAQISLVDEFAPDEFGLTRKFWFGLAVKGGWAQATNRGVDDKASWNVHLIASKRVFPWLNFYVTHGLATTAHYTRDGSTKGKMVTNVGFGIYFNPFYWLKTLENIRLMGEYFLPYRKYINRHNSWGGGIAIVTGSHSFGIIVTNSIGSTLDTNAQGPAEKEEVHLGFNITRRFERALTRWFD